MTTDLDAAAKFYGEVLGWTSQDVSQPGAPYRAFSAGETMVAGVLPAFEGGPPQGWMGYIAVDDVDDMAKAITAAGGLIHRPPADIPGIGRFAVAADPHEAVFVIFKAAGEGAIPADGVPGHAGWRELMAGDLETDFAFYAKLFGWTVAQEIPMGPMGIYRVFATGGEGWAGGMMTKPAAVPRAMWRYAFQVDSAKAALQRITAAGGAIVNPPHQVPGGNWIVQATDPQGAFFVAMSMTQ
jgi:predicted enzyme related to lactoylglutathione lyase